MIMCNDTVVTEHNERRLGLSNSSVVMEHGNNRIEEYKITHIHVRDAEEGHRERQHVCIKLPLGA